MKEHVWFCPRKNELIIFNMHPGQCFMEACWGNIPKDIEEVQIEFDKTTHDCSGRLIDKTGNVLEYVGVL